ncbi:MAG: lytic transglycosylase domain-containing protein [Clostridia bacterium]|nr:lytic transglycosylase domain-containing protein [Clostridia bacterium]
MRIGTPSPKRKKEQGCLGRLFSFFLVLVLLLGLGLWMTDRFGIKTYVLRTQYPIKYQTLVDTYAQKTGLEPEMVYAIIRTESKFDPYAVSRTGARGLMQIQEETAKDCIRELKMDGITPDALFDPEVNIRLGCYYFSKLLKRFNGNFVHAAAAYNGGLGNVSQWIKNSENLDENGTLAVIPFPETKNYVKRITEAYEKYHQLYP